MTSLQLQNKNKTEKCLLNPGKDRQTKLLKMPSSRAAAREESMSELFISVDLICIDINPTFFFWYKVSGQRRAPPASTNI